MNRAKRYRYLILVLLSVAVILQVQERESRASVTRPAVSRTPRVAVGDPKATPTPSQIEASPAPTKVQPRPLTRNPFDKSPLVRNEYSVAGIQPGMLLSEVKERHGVVKNAGYSNIYTIGEPEIAYIRLDEEKRVDFVSGRRLERGGSTILEFPDDSNRVKAVLGEPEESWSNNSWCGNCRASIERYAKNLEIRYAFGQTARFQLSDTPRPIPSHWRKPGEKMVRPDFSD